MEPQGVLTKEEEYALPSIGYAVGKQYYLLQPL